MDHIALVVVASFVNQFEADIAKATLEAAGIESMIQADTCGGMRTHIAWSGAGYKLLVREEDAQAAREVLDSLPPAGCEEESQEPLA